MFHNFGGLFLLCDPFPSGKLSVCACIHLENFPLKLPPLVYAVICAGLRRSRLTVCMRCRDKLRRWLILYWKVCGLEMIPTSFVFPLVFLPPLFSSTLDMQLRLYPLFILCWSSSTKIDTFRLLSVNGWHLGIFCIIKFMINFIFQ